MSFCSFLASRVSVEKSVDSLMGVPLYIICHFSLVSFNILSLSLIFVSLITMCLGAFFLGFILPGTLCFLNLVDYFLSHVWDVFSYYLFKYFLRSFLYLFSFWDPYNTYVGTFNVFPEVLGCLHFFYSFFYILFCSSDFFFIFNLNLFILIGGCYFTILYWFCHTSTCIRHGCTCVPQPEPLLPPPSPYHPSGSFHHTWTGDLFHI